MTDPTIAARDLRALPKGHLHLHMEAAMRATTLAELAGARGLPVPQTTVFTGFSQFADVYRTILAVLQHPNHLARVIDEIVEDQAAQGVVYVEIGVNPDYYAGTFGSVIDALGVLVAAAQEAQRRHGVAVGLMPTIDRTSDAASAMVVARAAAEFAGRGVVSLGLANDERGAPASTFAAAFAVGREAGLFVTPHAGELEGPEFVWEAIDLLGANRVQHGVRAIEDPRLVAELAVRGIPLDVCPTSNVLLDVVDELAAHPLPRLIDAGVRCTINADDPLIFGPDILAEYELCRSAFGLTDEQLAACAWASIEVTRAPSDVKTAARAGIDAWLASA
ncbi:adenosine deaminase [Microbacteriaceae bacterium VKM Ac-2854]|nr:adenosine deaminase [Microbacteriaceae bacterium VKM Ac-2854]